jgi:hypothetical protein
MKKEEEGKDDEGIGQGRRNKKREGFSGLYSGGVETEGEDLHSL